MRRTRAIIGTSLILSSLLLGAPAFAAQSGLQEGQGLIEKAGKIAYGSDKPRQIEEIIGSIIQTFISILGILFLGLAIYAGYLWMTARGAEDQVKKAKSILEQSAIGIIIILAAYALTAFIVSRLVTATGTTGGSGAPAACREGQKACPDGTCISADLECPF